MTVNNTFTYQDLDEIMAAINHRAVEFLDKRDEIGISKWDREYWNKRNDDMTKIFVKAFEMKKLLKK